MKRLALLAAGFSVAMVAHAQSEPMDFTNFSVRAGFVYPLEETTRDLIGNMIGLGIDYQTPRSLIPGGTGYLSLEWFGDDFGNPSGSIIPIMYNERFYLSGRLEGERSYAFLGTGLMIVDLSSSKTLIGARGGIGKELGPHLFAEAQLTTSDNVDGGNGNTLGVFLGYKF